MIRTALRIATVAALSNAGNVPYPTAAGADIFDSRDDPLSDIALGERRPVIVVRTSDDSITHRADSAPQRTALRREIEVTLEIAIMTAVRDAGGNPIAAWPVTNPMLEAWLDAIEMQANIALSGSGIWSVWYNSLGFARLSWNSRAAFEEDTRTSARLAARTISIAMLTPFDRPPGPLTLKGSDIPDTSAIPHTLKGVLDKIAADGAGDFQAAMGQLMTSLESLTFPVRPVWPLLEGTHITVEESEP